MPETIVGRWPVRNVTELSHVINKTIGFECLTNVTRRFSLFSGTGNGENDFASDVTSAFNKLATTPSSSSIMYDGRYGFTHTDIINEFSNHNDLLFVYRGHSNETRLGTPYTAISYLNIPSNQSYFSIGLSCLLNRPVDYNFGNRWINNGDRACGIYGSTTESDRSSNSYLSKHLFDYYAEQATNLTWGQWMSGAAAKYYSSLSTSARKKQTKKYLILGDPSLYIFGFDSVTCSPKPYQIKSMTRNTTSIETILEDMDDENIKSVSVYDVTGRLVTYKCFEYHPYSTEVITSLIEGLAAGVYVVTTQTESTQYVTKIHKSL